ncbi:MAG TPA: hypothetical protein VKA95_07530 [Nitrososphaeraceae archaeon]|nr:hypothetical protein [Nitrososphaeraceae archaeon]
MGEHPNFRAAKPILLRGIETISKDVFKQAASEFIGKRGLKGLNENFLPFLDLINEADKNSFSYEGILRLEKEHLP